MPSAHFEHTVLTTEKGPEILTVPRLLSPPPPAASLSQTATKSA
jgi:methionyl aminopeptidase